MTTAYGRFDYIWYCRAAVVRPIGAHDLKRKYGLYPSFTATYFLFWFLRRSRRVALPSRWKGPNHATCNHSAYGRAGSIASVETQSLSSNDLTRRTIERRAVEAVNWGMPAVNADLGPIDIQDSQIA